jgi:phage major head subunit gpT-like protein
MALAAQLPMNATRPQMQGQLGEVQAPGQFYIGQSYIDTSRPTTAQLSTATAAMIANIAAQPAMINSGADYAVVTPRQITLPDATGNAVLASMQQNQMMQMAAAGQQALTARNVWEAREAARNVAAAYERGPIAAIDKLRRW